VAEFTIRGARSEDARARALLFARVAEERDGIASEPPVDLEQRTAQFAHTAAASHVAVAGSAIIGTIHVETGRFGTGDVGMLVAADWRGRGVGTALLEAAIARSREQGLHKLCLEVFATNAAAIALYRRCGFAEEGLRVQQYRRASGELWDAVVMGLLL
jgi:ribosomal protein S18 acetylase RimI-like enzyme